MLHILGRCLKIIAGQWGQIDQSLLFDSLRTKLIGHHDAKKRILFVLEMTDNVCLHCDPVVTKGHLSDTLGDTVANMKRNTSIADSDLLVLTTADGRSTTVNPGGYYPGPSFS